MRLLPKWLVGDGSLPENERATIAGEGQLFLEEGLRGTISYLHFRTRGRRYGKAVRWTDFSIGVSEKRVLVYEHSGHTKVVDVPFDDPRGAALDVSLDEDKVVIHIDLDRFGTPNAHGQITIRIPTPNAAAIVDALQSRLATP